MQQALQSQEFILRHCEDPRDFSRQRLLTFERVALFFLQGACSSLRFGMQQLLQSLLGNGGFQSGLTVSRQAVSKACRKFPYQAFVSLQQQAVDTFYAQRDTPRWMGLRLVGVDGTKVRLPRTSTMAQAFGTQTNDRKRARPMALMVAHYDVLARMPLCAELSPCSMGERFLAERLLAGRNQDDLLLYDRGFPSYALFALHQARGVPVCMRLPRRFHPDVDAFIGNGAAEHEITLIPTAKQRKDAQALGIEPEPVTLRLVCVRLKSGEVEVLATSLRDTQRYPAHLFKDLYAKRWGIEEGFKALKPWAKLEVFRTEQVSAVYQEVHARWLMLTLTAISNQLVQGRVEQQMSHRQQDYKVNVLASLRKFRDQLYRLWRGLADQDLFDAFLEWVADDANAVRPGRSYKRKPQFVSPLAGMGA